MKSLNPCVVSYKLNFRMSIFFTSKIFKTIHTANMNDYYSRNSNLCSLSIIISSICLYVNRKKIPAIILYLMAGIFTL